MDKFNPQKLSVQTPIKNRKIFDLVNFNVNNFDELYNVPQKLDTELQNYRDGDIIKITNISSGGNRK